MLTIDNYPITLKLIALRISLDASNPQQDGNSAEDHTSGPTLYAIIPQQQLTEGISTSLAGAALDQATITTLLNLANEEKANVNTQGLSTIK